jgi:hypothetical protein
MRASLTIPAAFACLMLVPGAASPGEPPDLSKLDRAIHREPTYTSPRPLYGLAVFGPKGEKRVWMVLDKSKPNGEQYDVLHVDLNADGDLTGPGERLERSPDGTFKVGDFKDPATGAPHAAFEVRVWGDGPDVMLSLRWRGQFKFGGGYPEDPEPGYMRFSQRREEAPAVWVYGDAPFRFQRWYGGKLRIGGQEDFKVFLGQPGRGRSTFCAAQQHILQDGESVQATLIYTDGSGKERRAVCELKERC